MVEKHLKEEQEQVGRLLGRKDGVPHHRIRENLRTLLTEKVGIFRGERDMAEAVASIGELRQQYKTVACRTPLGPFNCEIINVRELESLLYLSEATARGALARKESRGSHFRTDHPKRNDTNWLKHTVARVDGEEIKLSYSDVDVSHYEPKERTY